MQRFLSDRSSISPVIFQVAETHPESLEADGVSRRFQNSKQALYPFLKLNDLLIKTLID